MEAVHFGIWSFLMGSLFDAQKMLISSFCMRDASVLPEKLLFDNIDGTCTTKEICILPSALPDKLCYKYDTMSGNTDAIHKKYDKKHTLKCR